MPSTGSIPLQTVIPGQLIASALWNAEFANINSLMTPSGIDTYSATDSQMQTQTNPFPGSVTSHATALAGEFERIRYQLAQILGTDYWYKPAAISLATLDDVVVPIGGIIDWAWSVEPSSKWKFCSGQEISRATYSELFALVGVTFGSGDGVTTFNLPDYRDRMSIGSSSHILGATGGEAEHTLTTAEIPSVNITDPGHTHGITDPGHNHIEQGDNGVFGSVYSMATTAPNPRLYGPSTVPTVANTTGITVNANTTGITAGGGGGAHNNMPPYIAMGKIIRVL